MMEAVRERELELTMNRVEAFFTIASIGKSSTIHAKTMSDITAFTHSTVCLSREARLRPLNDLNIVFSTLA